MNKVIGIPTSSIASNAHLTFIERLINDLRLQIWSFKCKRMEYKRLVADSKYFLEDLLEAHKIKSSYHQNINFEATIESNKGWKIEISKAFYAKEESIILILFKDQSVGQASFSICFENENGVIRGIKNMFHGLLFEQFFYDLECPYLNPTVLAALKTAEKSLKKGKITSLSCSNRPQEFGLSKMQKSDISLGKEEQRINDVRGYELK